MSNLNDSLDESSKFKLIQLRELLKKIDDALPLNDQQLLRYSGVLDRREKQQLPILRGLQKGDSLLNSTNTLQSTVSSVDKLTLSPIKLSLSPPKLTSTPIKGDQIYQTKHHHNSTKSNQSSAAISNKPKTMSYHFTLAVTKFSHTETSRKFSTFLSQLRDAFAIDGVTDENTKFPLLRSRFEDKAREMLPNKFPDETFDEYLTRLAPIIDDTLITNDLETQYSFFKLNFSNDKFEKTLREFVQLHETMYRDLPAELNFQSFRRRLLDLLTPKPYLFKVVLNSTATTNPTLVTALLHFFKANGLLYRHSSDNSERVKEKCNWCQIPGHREENCGKKSRGIPKGNYNRNSQSFNQKQTSSPNTFTVKNESNNNSSNATQPFPLIIKEVMVNDTPLKALIDPGSNITCIDSKIKNKIISSDVPETIHQVFSNGHLHFTKSALSPTTISLDGHSHTLDTVFINSISYSGYDVLIGMDLLQPLGAIIHASTGIVDFEEPPPNTQVNTAVLGDPIIDLDLEKKLKDDILQKYPSITPSHEYDMGEGRIVAPEQIIFPDKDIPDFKYYHTPQTPELKTLIDRLEENGIIERSDAIETCPYYMLSKRDSTGKLALNSDGTPRRRFILDARRVNAATRKIVQQSPHFTTIIGSMHPFTLASKIDLTNSFFQISLHKNNRHHFSFTAFNQTYQFCRLVQGARNSPALFQRSIEQLIPNIENAQIFTYIDDLLILTNSTPEHHYESTLQVISSLDARGLKINISKCEFFRDSITYLGWTFKGATYEPAVDSVYALMKKSRPTTKKQLYSRLQSINYFRMMSPLFTKYSKRLHSLATSKSSKDLVEWSPELIDDYDNLLKCVFASPLHLMPTNEPYTLKIKVDACQTGIGSSLIYVTQSCDIPKPIAHYSFKLPVTKKDRSPTYLELLGIKKSLDYFHFFIVNANSTVIVESDHRPLQFIHKSSEKHLTDLIQCICAYDIKITYVNQSSNQLADSISRLFSSNNVILKKRGRPKKVQFLHGEVDQFDSLDIHVLELQSNEKSLLDAVENNTPWEGVHVKRRGDDVIVTSTNQIVIPENIETINKILFLSHDKSDHYGIERTLQTILASTFIPHVRKYVSDYLANCSICQSTNPAPSKPVDSNSNYNFHFPWQNVACDILGPLKETSKKNKHIILFTDIVTKYRIAAPLPDTTSSTIMNVITTIIQTHGPMKLLRMDNAPYFKGIEKSLSEIGIMSSFITPLNSSGNAFAERHIECLQHTLTKEMLSQSGKEWDDLVGLIVYYYNISSKQNQPSPYELHFSRLPVSPLSLRLKASSFINNKEKEMTNLPSTKTAYYKKKSTRKLEPKYSDPCQLQSISNDKKTALLITHDGRKLRRSSRNLKVKG